MRKMKKIKRSRNNMSRIITVTSGKGGVGKTNISVNMALYLAGQGYSVCLFDADMGLANVDILMGLYPEYTLEDVFLGNKSLHEVIISTPSGIDIVPGGSGVKILADPEQKDVDSLIKTLSELDNYDFLIFDTSAGISKSVISFCMASPEIILVVTPEPTSLTDAYALLKILRLNKFDSTVMVAINQCMSMEVANKLYTKFKEVVQKYLKLDIFPIGTVPLDSHVPKAVKEQKPLLSVYPNSDSAKGIKNIARHLISKGSSDIDDYDLTDFWIKYLDMLKSDSTITDNKKKAVQAAEELPVAQKKLLREPEEEETAGEPEIIERQIPAKVADEALIKDRQVDAGDISRMLEGLVRGVSTISSELGAIRKMMENDRGKILKRGLDSEKTGPVI